MTGPRRLKRKIELSDEEEATFINNSDYDVSSSALATKNGSQGSEQIGSHEPSSPNVSVDQEEQEEQDGAENVPLVSNGSHMAIDAETPKSAPETNENSENERSPDLTNNVETLNTSDEIETRSEKLKMQPELKLPPPVASPSASTNYGDQEDIALIPSKKKESTIVKTHPRKCEPRLVIDQLVLTNFKSYAGRQVIGPFNASFSAVVGPNGSGKSNVIDSMLFVFGFRALKMRQGKLSELIHNSAGGQKLDFCQVDIHFHHVLDDEHDDTKTEVLPDSGLIVSRRANRNNSSSYYINGKTSNYTEVTTLLRDKGIDLDHKRFLILQGEVESIAQMKPKAEREGDDGLLEYLEDIIGTSNYKQLIEDGLAKVDELNDVCIEKANRFELVEKDKNQLEEKKNEALKFLEMEKKLVTAKSIQYQISLHDTTKSLEEHQKLHTELNEEYSQEKAKNAELNSQLKEGTKKQAALNKIIASVNQRIKQLNEELRKINKAKVSMDERIKNLTNKLKKATKTNEQLVHAVLMTQLKLESQNEASQEYKRELKELGKSLEEEKAKLNEIRKKMTSKTSTFTQKIEELQTKLEPWNDEVKEKESAIQLIDSTIEMLESQGNLIEQKLEAAKQRLLDIKTEGKSKEAEYQDNHTKLTHITEQIQLGEEQCNHERKQLQQKKNDLVNMRQRTQDALSTHSHNQNKNRVLAGLTRLAKSGRISGFHGRLGDLGVIDDDYDIAISTACPALDSMVVETVETAQNCIQYLRKNNLGYANFICLDKLRKFDMGPIKTPGNPTTVKRLFDLITPKDPKFLPAFYSKLFNTLVASNLQEARLVAYGAKRFRVVTLDGKVVDTSGTMSGGGNHFSKGGMVLSSAKMADQMDLSDEDIDQMKEDLQNMETRFNSTKAELEDKEQKLRNLRDMKPEIEFNISKLKLEIDSLTSEKKETTQLCKKLLQELEDDQTSKDIEQQIESKRAEKLKLTLEKEALKSEMRGMESQIKELEEKILEAGGVELGIQNAKVDSINQKIEIINQKTSNERMAIRKLENEINRHKKLVEESSEEIEKAKLELQAVESQDSNHQEQLDEINKKTAEEESQKDLEEEKLEMITTELEEKKQTINKFKSYEIELENRLEKINSLIRKCTQQIKADQESLDALIVRDTSEYIGWMPSEEQAKYNGNEIEKLSEEELKTTDIEQVNEEIAELEKYMSNVHVDIEVLKEYGSKITEFTSRKEELSLSINQRDQIKDHCEELKRKRLDEFMEGFNTISLSLKEMYQMITMGGNAELELVDSLDPFSEGILFSVMPPKKSWRNISNLSGGEKTLSSLALVFALHKYKPTPLYVMDEIDAALDFRNVSIVANYIKERTKNGQFIVISLRNNMFELAKQLVGIYKVNNMTKSISIQNREFF